MLGISNTPLLGTRIRDATGLRHAWEVHRSLLRVGSVRVDRTVVMVESRRVQRELGDVPVLIRIRPQWPADPR